ncbi:uncharacterized protein LOC126379956 [Pectinophora gossypiella]|uniref:uncharacterized protein LOC126379956 n=1 Tax=Pectinophora gossypiella TaxID=13191 RepID=UPI00214E11CC|nr:uncharacterized protein LOC126379956 [Pectinophora gossypiella]
MPATLDPVTLNAVDAVIEATEKIMRARSYLWAWMVIEDSTFKRSEYAPKEYWQFDVDLQPLMGTECIKCCQILIDNMNSKPEIKNADETDEFDAKEFKEYWRSLTKPG